jgi:predicted DCC family thiol-disulfide oxidoreductase YuxK
MNSQKTDEEKTKSSFNEWVFYDDDCSLCTGLVRRYKTALNRRGIGLVPLQSEFARKRTAGMADPYKEMLLLPADGNMIGGADAFIYISRKIWWAYGFYLLAQVPGMRRVYRWFYGLIARNRHCSWVKKS